MFIYWFIFFCLALAAVNERSRVSQETAIGSISAIWLLSLGFLALTMGFRHEVGGDWGPYLAQVRAMESVGWVDLLIASDPGYALLNWLGFYLGGGIYFTNLVSAVIFLTGVSRFARSQTRPWLVMLVAMPYLILVVGMGYTRQAVALGFGMVALTALLRERVGSFVVFIALAVLFHKTAIVLLGFLLFTREAKRWTNLLLFVFASGALFVWFLQDYIAHFISNYLVAGYESSGAAIRILMNALPALIFLGYRGRFHLTRSESRFWTGMAWLAVGFVALLIVSPSSTAVDRIALYLIPIQLFVWSRLPDALGGMGKLNVIWTTAVVSYSALILFVWLTFAHHAPSWVPYQFYPWEWFWSLWN